MRTGQALPLSRLRNAAQGGALQGPPGGLSQRALGLPSGGRQSVRRAGGVGGGQGEAAQMDRGSSLVSALLGARTGHCHSAALPHPSRTSSTNVWTLLFLMLYRLGSLGARPIAKKLRFREQIRRR